jgi:capsid protein
MQRKASINAMLALFMKKTQDKPSSRSITGGAVRKGEITATAESGEARTYKMQEHMPGLVMEELQVGEEPVAFGNEGVDINFSEYESSVLSVIAWVYQIPPEILQMSFSSNYSASQAALNEFRNYLNKFRNSFGADFCTPIYREWFLSLVLKGRIKAKQFLESYRNTELYDIYGAWVKCDWSGAVKPVLDLVKLTTYYKNLADMGCVTMDRAAKETTGTKFSRNVKTLRREIAQLKELENIKNGGNEQNTAI